MFVGWFVLSHQPLLLSTMGLCLCIIFSQLLCYVWCIHRAANETQIIGIDLNDGILSKAVELAKNDLYGYVSIGRIPCYQLQNL